MIEAQYVDTAEALVREQGHTTDRVTKTMFTWSIGRHDYSVNLVGARLWFENNNSGVGCWTTNRGLPHILRMVDAATR